MVHAQSLLTRYRGWRALGGRASSRAAAILTAVAALGLAFGGVWYWQDAKEKEEARIAAEQKAEKEREATEAERRIAEKKAKADNAEVGRKQKEEAAREAEKKTEAERRAAEAKRIAKKESVKADTEKRAREVSEKIAENTRLAIKAFEAKQWEEGYRLSKDADLNDKEIQCYLGFMYWKGYGVTKDYSEAVKWYRKAAKQGNANAQFVLGWMYQQGFGVAKDDSEAVKWYWKVIEQGEKEGVAIEVRRVAEMAKDNLRRIQHKEPLRTLETKAKAEAEGVRKTEDAKIGAENKAKDEGVKRIQLWEGGPYWADRNIGAERPEDFGYYFWWGDTVGYKRMIAVVYGSEKNKWVASNGSNSNFRFVDDNTPTYRKKDSYLESQGWVEMKNDTYICLTLEHDAAHKHWGGAWRMPTKQELDDLNKRCDWSWEMRNGVNGYIVRGKGSYASKSIFLPAAGYVKFYDLENVGSHGYLWSSELEKETSYSYRLLFDSGFHATGDEFYRHYGYPVRPVQGFTK